MMCKSTLEKIGDLTNNELRNLLKEIQSLNNSKIPATIVKSNQLTALFDIEQSRPEESSYLDRSLYIEQAVKIEIIYRIAHDEM